MSYLTNIDLSYITDLEEDERQEAEIARQVREEQEVEERERSEARGRRFDPFAAVIPTHEEKDAAKREFMERARNRGKIGAQEKMGLFHEINGFVNRKRRAAIYRAEEIFRDLNVAYGKSENAPESENKNVTIPQITYDFLLTSRRSWREKWTKTEREHETTTSQLRKSIEDLKKKLRNCACELQEENESLKRELRERTEKCSDQINEIRDLKNELEQTRTQEMEGERETVTIGAREWRDYQNLVAEREMRRREAYSSLQYRRSRFVDQEEAPQYE